MDRASYVMSLQSQSSTFDPVQDVNCKVEGYVPPPTPAPSDGGGSVNIAVIVGASVGGAALVILIVLVVMRQRTGNIGVSGTQNNARESQNETSTEQNYKVSTEILVEPQDDISTLGDPMFGQGGMMMHGLDKDEVTARYVFESVLSVQNFLAL
jgi:hypothetical protein